MSSPRWWRWIEARPWARRAAVGVVFAAGFVAASFHRMSFNEQMMAARVAGVIATAAVYRDGSIVRGKIPAPVVRALKAGDGDVLVFERGPGGAVVVRKATKGTAKKAAKQGGKK